MDSRAAVDAPTGPVDDAELTRLALAADPDAPLPDDAVPFGGDPHDPSAPNGADVLPSWYMPAPAVDGTGARQLTGWRRRVAWGIIGASLAVAASGLCNTYGILEIA